MPRWLLADPLRSRAWSTSPVRALVAAKIVRHWLGTWSEPEKRRRIVSATDGLEQTATPDRCRNGCLGTRYVMTSGPGFEALRSQARDIRPNDQHGDSDDVQPQPVEHRAGRHDPKPGEYEQKAADYADPREVDAPLPLISDPSQSSHGMRMVPSRAAV